MIILIEGPDGAGKSTLARVLANKYNLAYYHEGAPPTNVTALDYYSRKLEGFRDQNVVLDRFALGQRVYGPIFRNDTWFDAQKWSVFKRLIVATGAYQIMCFPSYKTCFDSWASGRPEMITDPDVFTRTYTLFGSLRDECDFIYDYEMDTFKDLFAAIDDHEASLDRT